MSILYVRVCVCVCVCVCCVSSTRFFCVRRGARWRGNSDGSDLDRIGVGNTPIEGRGRCVMRWTTWCLLSGLARVVQNGRNE